MKQYDLIIIGAGQAGIPLAKKMAAAGKKTALIEKRFVGGTCINDGCTPTKAMVASARAIYRAKNASTLGIHIGEIKVDMPHIKQRKDEIVAAFRAAAQTSLEETAGLDLIFGDASFTGMKEIMVKLHSGGSQKLKAKWIFINTGAKPVIPEIEGLAGVAYLTSTTILDLEEVPGHLVIVGGNYVGLEFAQLFHRFGSRITVLERSERIMGREDKDTADEMCNILEQEGLCILNETYIEKAKTMLDGNILLRMNHAGKKRVMECTHMLIATGRSANTELLNLSSTGVEMDSRGNILVSANLETTMPGIFSLGDVKGGPAFTHISYNDHVIVYNNLMENGRMTITDRAVPYCMFTDPQLARIGLSEKEAKEKGLNYKVGVLPMNEVARSLENGEHAGFIKVVVDAVTKKILGVTVIASEGGEIMSVLQMAMAGGLTYDQLKYFVFAHPTYAEAINNLMLKIT